MISLRQPLSPLTIPAIMVVLTLGGVPDLWARHRLILFGTRRKVVSNFAEDRNLSILFPLDMLRNYPVAWFCSCCGGEGLACNSFK